MVVVSRPVMRRTAIDQRFAVMRAGAADERAIDVEEDECAVGQEQ